MRKRSGGGSRYLYEPFEAAARLETHERVTDERWRSLEKRLATIEAALERLEKRLWLAVYGVAAVVLARAAQTFFGIAGG
ncbi:MAG: hypothetical protein GY952_03655 [Rhodobacteraceae bacterium]|nr:hypothetical protein [Paracoccaceae bacterium]